MWSLVVESFHLTIVGFVISGMIVICRFQKCFYFCLFLVLFSYEFRKVAFDEGKLSIWFQILVVPTSAIPLILKELFPAPDKIFPRFPDTFIVSLLILVQILQILVCHDVFFELQGYWISPIRVHISFVVVLLPLPYLTWGKRSKGLRQVAEVFPNMGGLVEYVGVLVASQVIGVVAGLVRLGGANVEEKVPKDESSKNDGCNGDNVAV